MNIILTLYAKLDYPSAPVMLVSTALMVAFIWGGGLWFKRLEERSKAERQARRAKIAAEKKSTNP
jgi:hypothetical protein